MAGRQISTATLAAATGVAVLTLLLAADPAAANSTRLPLPLAVDLNPLHLVGDGLNAVKDTVLGPIKIGVKEIANLLATVVLTIADMLIPDSLNKVPSAVIQWTVATENWAVQARGGRPIYASINRMHDVLSWAGIALLSGGLTWSALSVMAGHRSVEDVARGWGIAIAGTLLMKWGWGQATAITNSLTHMILVQPEVKRGLSTMLGFVLGTGLVGAFASGGMLVPVLAIAAAVLFLGLIAAKTMLLMVGAMVFISGGLVFPLATWPFGEVVVRAWFSLAAAVFAIPIVWALLFAISGVLMSDATMAGKAGAFGGAPKFLVPWLLGIGACVSLVAALKAAKLIFSAAQAAPLALLGGVSGGRGRSGGNTESESSGSTRARAAQAAAAVSGAGSAGQAFQALASQSSSNVAAGGGKRAHLSNAVGRGASSMARTTAGERGGRIVEAAHDRGKAKKAAKDSPNAAPNTKPTSSTGTASMPGAKGQSPQRRQDSRRSQAGGHKQGAGSAGTGPKSGAVSRGTARPKHTSTQQPAGRTGAPATPGRQPHRQATSHTAGRPTPGAGAPSTVTVPKLAGGTAAAAGRPSDKAGMPNGGGSAPPPARPPSTPAHQPSTANKPGGGTSVAGLPADRPGAAGDAFGRPASPRPKPTRPNGPSKR